MKVNLNLHRNNFLGALDDIEEEEETTTSKSSKSESTKAETKKEEKPEKKTVNSNANTKDEEADKLVSEEVKKLMESLVQTGELEKGLEEVLKSLDINEDALGNIPSLEELQNVDEETMEKILSEIQQKPEMVKAVEDMMSAFMSKDLMYEPMKEIRDRVSFEILFFDFPSIQNGWKPTNQSFRVKNIQTTLSKWLV